MIGLEGLPASYRRLEYIENISTAYIDCGLQPKYTFDYEIKTDINTPNIILGCKLTSDRSDFRFFYHNQAYFDVGYDRIQLRVDYQKPMHIKFGNYFVEDLTNKNITTGTTFDEKMNNAIISNLVLFREYQNTTPKGKVWLLKINDNGKPIREFIPVMRTLDGIIGMYDLVERKFYTSPNGVLFMGG